MMERGKMDEKECQKKNSQQAFIDTWMHCFLTQLQNRALKNLKYLPNGNEFWKIVHRYLNWARSEQKPCCCFPRFTFICSKNTFEVDWSKLL